MVLVSTGALSRALLKKFMADEPVSRIDQPGIDKIQVIDFSQRQFVNDVNFGSEVSILATTLPQFFF